MRRARWRVVDDAGRQIRPGIIPEPYGSKEWVASHLVWLVPELAERGHAWVLEHLRRIDLPGLATAKPSAKPLMNTGAAPSRANRERNAG